MLNKNSRLLSQQFFENFLHFSTFQLRVVNQKKWPQERRMQDPTGKGGERALEGEGDKKLINKKLSGQNVIFDSLAHRSLKTSPQAKRHKLSLLSTHLTIFTSLTIFTGFITK